MPGCFPDGTTNVTIFGSAGFTELGKDDIPSSNRNFFTSFSLIASYLRDVDKDAFHGMDNLKTLQIMSSMYLEKIEFEKDTAPKKLEDLRLVLNVELGDIEGLKYMKTLKHINFTGCELRKVQNDMFEGLTNVETLYLHKNLKLYYISSNAFKDLVKLRVLHLDDCALEGLYSDYFETSWDLGTLKEVNTMSNPFRCSKMCSMHRWLKNNPEFNEIASLGTCYKYGSLYAVKALDENLAGCGLGGWAIFGICMGSLLVICFIAAGIAAIREKKMKKRHQATMAARGTAMTSSEPSTSYRRTMISRQALNYTLRDDTQGIRQGNGARTTQQATPHTVDAVVQENEEAIYEEIVIATSNDENIYKITEDANTPRYEEIDATDNNEYVYTILKEASQQQMASTFNTTEMDNKAFQLNEDCVNVPPSVPEYEQI